jgi:uroporphyrinogen-III synthase
MGALTGRRVLVTRAEDDAAAWVEVLERAGAQPVVLPCLSTRALDDRETASRLRTAMATTDWLVLTSRRAVECVDALLVAPPNGKVRIAAVGPATARAARRAWGRVDREATIPTSVGLAVDLLVACSTTAVDAPSAVFAGAVDGQRSGEDILRANGWHTVTIGVYETTPAPPAPCRIDLSAESLDDILLASPSAVTGLLNLAVPPRTARIYTIGPTTTAAALAAGLVVTAEARRPGLEGLLEAMQ